MSELERRIQEASRGLAPKIGPADTERELSRLVSTERKQTQRRALALSSGVGLTIVALAYFFAPRPTPTPAPEVAAAPAERAVHFSDGSIAMLLSERTVIRVGESRDDLLEIQLDVGKARFDVVPNPGRLFRVVTKDLRVEVLGTSFTVADEDGRSSVWVHRGRVAAIAGNDRHELVAGMSFELDDAVAESPEEPAEELLPGEPALDDELDQPLPKRRVKAGQRKVKPRQWRHLAEEGLFREAYDAMGEEKSPPANDDVPGLMLAADVARLTGHPQEAVGYLRTVTSHHPREPQAVLAAFTLGRILERELSRPAEAAEAYETARRLGPDGSLAEDALAHEVDCWAKAKQPAKSKERAELYLSTYPEGRRSARMRSMIGKE